MRTFMRDIYHACIAGVKPVECAPLPNETDGGELSNRGENRRAGVDAQHGGQCVLFAAAPGGLPRRVADRSGIATARGVADTSTVSVGKHPARFSISRVQRSRHRGGLSASERSDGDETDGAGG